MSRAPTPIRPTLPRSLPGYALLLLAEAVFVVFKWILPSLCTAEVCLRPQAQGWSVLAWLAAGLVLLAAWRPGRLFRTAGH
ncbi:MAG TPA: hypothetical protein VF096_00555 [Azonexus sp.]